MEEEQKVNKEEMRKSQGQGEGGEGGGPGAGAGIRCSLRKAPRQSRWIPPEELQPLGSWISFP